MGRRCATTLCCLLAAVLVAAGCEVRAQDGSRYDCARSWVTEAYSHRHHHTAAHHPGPKHPHPGNYLHQHRRRVHKMVCTRLDAPTTTTSTTTSSTTTSSTSSTSTTSTSSTSTSSTTTTTVPPAGPAAVVAVGLAGVASGGQLAVDDVEVRGSASNTLHLSDAFSANLTATPQPYGTGSAPGFVTSDPAVNTSPVFSGFGVPPGVWFNPLNTPDLGTPEVVSGRLRPSATGTLDQLVWDLTQDPVKVSFKVSVLPASVDAAHFEQAFLYFIDPSALLPAATMTITPEGAQLLAGDISDGTLTGTAAPVAISAGDRITLSRQGTVYKMWRNATLVSTVDVTTLGRLSGTVAYAGDTTTCSVEGYTATPTTGPVTGRALFAVEVAADGSFSVPALPSAPAKLRATCTGGSQPAWLGGGSDADRGAATTVTAVAGTTTPVGTITVT